MLSPRERQALQEIERGLHHSDPSLARRLQGAPPVNAPPNPPPNLRLMWLLLASLPMVAALLAVALSHPGWALVGVMVSVATGCAYLICVPGERFTRPG
jgi:hypothetical protein